MTTPTWDFTRIDLKSDVHSCLHELEEVANGLAYLDHIYGQILDDLDRRTHEWELIEADAAEKVRDDLPERATATEVKAAITKLVESNEAWARAHYKFVEAKRRKAKCERWMRTLEKRGSFAQAARNGHEQIARFAGDATGEPQLRRAA